MNKVSMEGVSVDIHLNSGVGIYPPDQLEAPEIDAVVKVRDCYPRDYYMRLKLGRSAVYCTPTQAREIADKLLQAVYDYELTTGNKVENMKGVAPK